MVFVVEVLVFVMQGTVGHHVQILTSVHQILVRIVLNALTWRMTTTANVSQDLRVKTVLEISTSVMVSRVVMVGV
jgi:hypothetical protein